MLVKWLSTSKVDSAINNLEEDTCVSINHTCCYIVCVVELTTHSGENTVCKYNLICAEVVFTVYCCVVDYICFTTVCTCVSY